MRVQVFQESGVTCLLDAAVAGYAAAALEPRASKDSPCSGFWACVAGVSRRDGDRDLQDSVSQSLQLTTADRCSRYPDCQNARFHTLPMLQMVPKRGEPCT